MERTSIHFEAVERKFWELVDTIKEYESDTFSASEMELTDDEAEQIACRMIYADIKHRIDMDTIMDGLMISEELDNIRDND